MVIRRKTRKDNRTIDLTGPDGNAFYLLGIARKTADQLGMNPEEVTEEMKEGDYDHLVAVFDKYFGHIFTLLR